VCALGRASHQNDVPGCDEHARCVFGNCAFRDASVRAATLNGTHNNVSHSCTDPLLEIIASHEFVSTAHPFVRNGARRASALCPNVRTKVAHCSQTYVLSVEDTVLIGVNTVLLCLRYHQLASEAIAV